MNINELIEAINKMKEKSSNQKRKVYNFDLAARIVRRLDSFKECNECMNFLNDLSSLIEEIKDEPLVKMNPKYALLQKNITAHLQKEHKLITEGYYTAVYMSMGVGLGLCFGAGIATALGQMAYMSIGLPIGIGIGLAIGAGLDAKAKKDGLVI